MKEKVLTQKQVKKLGLDKVSVITADMLEEYTSIGCSAFSYCYGLTSVTIPNSVTSIGDGAFKRCSGLTSVTIPNSVTSIGEDAFYGCSSLTSVTIPNSVTSIGDFAFAYCTGLTSVTIPNSVTSIGNYAFQDCTGLTSVTIPNSVTSIGAWAFSDCSGLTSVTIPNSVTSIGSDAFQDCTGLTSVNITDIAAWCNIAFSSDYSNPLYYAEHLYVNDVEVNNLVIPEGVTNIGDGAFEGCTGLTSVTIPNSVTSIGDYAFHGCSGLTSVTIGGIEYKPKTVINSKCKAYKAFNSDMTCRDFQYEKGKTYEFDGKPELCKKGFHACLNLADVFNYYAGELGKDVVVYEVKLEGVSNERQFDSKVVANKIKIGKRIL